MYTCAIFDMDGVLVDSEVHWKQVESSFLERLVPGWSKIDQAQIIGMSVRDVHQLLVTKYAVQISYDEYLAHYQALASDIYGKHSALIPGVDLLIQQLAARGVRMAVASSSPLLWIDIVIRRFGFGRYFETLVSADDLDGPSKPDPAIYRLATRRLGADPELCFAIEDTAKGLHSARGAGIFAIGLRNGFNEQQDFGSADLVVNSFIELIEALKSRGVL